MAVSMVVKWKDQDVRRMLRRVGPAKDRAVANGINKTATQTKTEAGREIRAEQRSLKAGIVSKSMAIKRANQATLTAVISATGKPIPLRDFKGTRFTRGRGRGKNRVGYVVTQVIPGQKKTVKGAFIGPGGHVFRRFSRSRLPIEKLFGPTVPSAFVKDQITRAMTNKANRVAGRLIESQLRRELAKVS